MAKENSLAYQQLHRLLRDLADAEYMLAHGPRRIAASEKKVDAGEASVLAQKDEIQKLKKSADEASLNLKTKEAHISKHAGRLNEAKSNKEYEIIQGQINAEKSACEELEDQILEMLSNVDDAQQALKSLEEEVDALKNKLTETKRVVAEKEPGLKADIDRLAEEIKEAETVVPAGEPRTTYNRLKAAQGADALSITEDGYCEHCNNQVTPQDAIRLNMGEFLLCRSCGRILYRIDD